MTSTPYPRSRIAKPTIRPLSAVRVGVGLSAFLTVATWCVWALRVPVQDVLPYWFWRPTVAPRPDVWLLLPLLLLAVGAVIFLRESSFPTWFNLAFLVCIGFAVQHMLALTEGRGLDGIRDRMVRTGHAGFAIEALRQPDMKRVATGYQEMLADGSLSFYPNATKPPGQLLFYMASARAARAASFLEGSPARKMTNFAALVWPLLASTAVIPLFWLSRLYLEGRYAYIPSLLYLFVPSVALIPLHLDQCLYPLLCITALALFAYGLRRRRPSLLFAAGVVTGVAVYVSFSLAVIAPYLLLVWALEAVLGRSSGPRWSLPRRALLPAAAYGAGGLAVWGMLVALTGYRFLDGYSLAVSAHQAWKIKAWSLEQVAFIGVLDLVEMAVWVGWVLAWLALGDMVSSWKLLRSEGEGREGLALAVAFVPLLLGLAFCTKTAAETARLWLFLVPALSLFAGRQLVRLGGERVWQLTGALAVLQCLSAFAAKQWQDFF